MSEAKNDFLPEGYSTPDAGGNYMKFEQGDNEFRVLSKPLIGWEYWNLEGKPVRIEGAQKPNVDPALIREDQQKNKHVKHFWIVVVYNYKIKAIQILEITQNKIQKDLESFILNPKWGSLTTYDVNVKKSGEKLQTKYQVIPTPHSVVSEDVKKAYMEKHPINLKALLTNGDPFAGVKAAVPTPPPASKVESLGEEVPF